MAIYFTGDTHADMRRFYNGRFSAQSDMTKDDYVVICGDFGGVWDHSERERELLDRLEGRNFTTLFVDGNHENFDMLYEMPVSQWHGGDVHFIRPSIIHLMRGQVFELDGKTLFTMGGASSHDIQGGILEPDDPCFSEKFMELRRQPEPFRINHVSWWAQELPSQEEYETARKNLERAGHKVDYIVTHSAPSSVLPDVNAHYETDAITDFLDEVYQNVEFGQWFFGHYHDDMIPREKMRLLYHDFVQPFE
jgi:predicted phosphodiesterase